MPEQCRTIVKAQFYSSTAHARQHCNICINEYDVPEFTKLPMLESLYNQKYWTRKVACLLSNKGF